MDEKMEELLRVAERVAKTTPPGQSVVGRLMENIVAGNMSQLVDLIQASHATEEEQKAMMRKIDCLLNLFGVLVKATEDDEEDE